MSSELQEDHSCEMSNQNTQMNTSEQSNQIIESESEKETENTKLQTPILENNVDAVTGKINALEIDTKRNQTKITHLTPLSPNEIKKQHLSRSLSDVSIASSKTSQLSTLQEISNEYETPKKDTNRSSVNVTGRQKSKSDSNIELDSMQINSPSVHDHGRESAQANGRRTTKDDGVHSSLPVLHALRSSEKKALRNSAPPSIAPESRRSSPQLRPSNISHIVEESAPASIMSKSHSTGRRSFIHRLFHHDDASNAQSHKNGHHSSAESDTSAHGSEDPEHHSKFIVEEEISSNAPAAFPSKKHRFHLDHLFRDLLHNKLHSPGSIFGSTGSVADSTAPSRSSSRNSMTGHSDDDEHHEHHEDPTSDDHSTDFKPPEEREKKHQVSSVKSRARAESSSTGRKRSNLTTAFRQLMMPAKHSTRAAKAAEAEAGSLPPDLLLEQKYGSCGRVLGKGAGGVVRMCQMVTTEGQKFNKVYAVKEFKKRKNETEREHVKKLTSEFCISSRLHHCNIIQTVDLVQDENKHWCEIMEYCPHGDLYEFIRSGSLEQVEIDCFFKQLIRGVEYLHSVGVAHRDLKPENLLIDEGAQLKITDFGVSDVFQIAWEKQPHYSKGVCGSEPYIAPEEFNGEPYDAREVDVWAMAVIYYALNFTGVPWRTATPNDPNYAYYLKYRGDRFEPFHRFPAQSRSLIHRMFEPNPKKRISVADIILSPWFIATETCSGVDAVPGAAPPHHHHSLQKKLAQQAVN